MYSRRSFLTAAARAAGAVALTGEAPGPASSERIDALVAQAMRELPIRAISIVATRDGTTLIDRGYGFADGEKMVPASSATPYPVGSVTKSFTAAAILALRDTGKIDLDAPVARYVAEAPMGSRITVRMLLEQRSGLVDIFGDYAWMQRMQHATAEQMLASVIDSPLRFTPGSQFEYSNTNYLLLGMALERIAKEPLFTVLKRFVLDPARLRETYLVGDRGVIHAIGYQRFTDPGGAPIAIPNSARKYWGAGALVSTARDLALWDAALLDGRVLGAASLKEMMHPVSPLPGGAHYAMGWFVDDLGGVARVRHGGNVPGFSSSNDLFPGEKITLSVLSNLSGIQMDRLADRIGAVLLDVPRADGQIFA